MNNLHKGSDPEIDRVQWLQVKKQLLYLARNSPFYRELFKNSNIDISAMGNYGNFRNIPLTKKEDLQQNNEKFLCVPKKEIIDYVTTSGTLGTPVSLALNENDLQRLAKNEMQSFKMVGITPEDTVQLTTTMDRRFMAGLAYFLGLRKLGAAVVRAGSGIPQLQWDSIERFKPKYLVAVPSFLLKMIDYAEKTGINIKDTSVKAVICIGEPIRNKENDLNALGEKIVSGWPVELFSTYASTEMATAFTECKFHKGNHLQPELIFAEILDDAGLPVKEGQEGELVVTTLQNETMPLLRFATGDIVSYSAGKCECGRNTLRLSPVMGRKQQLIKLKGTSLYPQHILNVLNDIEKLGNFVVEVRTNENGVDELKVKTSAKISDQDEVLIKDGIRGKLHISLDLQQVSEEEMNILKFSGETRKPRMFIDLRAPGNR